MIAHSSRKDLDYVDGLADGKRSGWTAPGDRIDGGALRNGQDRWRDLVRVNKKRWSGNTTVPDARHGEEPIQAARQDRG
jgi:hypothetical protein